MVELSIRSKGVMNLNKNYYSKIFFSYMSALVALCILVGAMISHQMYVEKKNNDNMISAYYENNYREAESKLQMFKNISEFLFDSEDVRNFAQNSTDNEYYNHLLIRKNMNTYMDIMINLGASITITDLKKTCIDSDGTMLFEDFIKKINITPENLNKVKEMTDNSRLFISENSAYLHFIFKHRYPSDNTIYCIVVIDKNHFLPISDDKTTFVIADTAANMQFESRRMSKAFAELDRHAKFYNHVDGNLYIRSSQQVENAVYLYESQNSFGIYGFIFLGILWVLLLLSCKRLAVWLTNKMYSPINQILDIFGYTEHSDDIEFLDSSIKKLVYNNQILATQLSESKVSMRNGFIVDLLYGVIGEETAAQYINEYTLSYLDAKCLCVTFLCDYNELSSNITKYDDARLIQTNYRETLKKNLCDSLTGEFIIIDKSRFVFITPEVSKSLLRNKLLAMLELSEEFYKIYPFIAIGRAVDTIKDIHISYNDTSEIITRKFNYLEKSIMFFDDLRSETNLFYYPIELENSLIENILYGDKEKVDKILTELLDTNLYELQLDKDNMTEFKFSITATIKRIIKMMNKPISEIFGENHIVYLDISHATTNDELAANVRGMVDKLCKFKSTSLNQKQRKTTSDILKYIEDNYNRDISLTDIAEYFCISAGHISRILKQDTGIGFKEYLDNLRVEEAKKLLSETAMTVNRIAENVGCNNARSFIRMFKNHTGYSPKEYRELMLF